MSDKISINASRTASCIFSLNSIEHSCLVTLLHAAEVLLLNISNCYAGVLAPFAFFWIWLLRVSFYWTF